MLPSAGLVARDRGAMYGVTLYGGTGGCDDIYPGCGIVFKLTPEGRGFRERTVYTFQNQGDGTGPMGLVRDRHGALYGLTTPGHSTTQVLFRLAPSRNGFSETTLYQFSSPQYPWGTLTLTADGSLYGTGLGIKTGTDGMIFRFTPHGKRFKEQLLYQFNGLNGMNPRSPLLIDSSGVIYGTTAQGGTGPSGPECLGGGCGTIFMLRPSSSGYTETLLYSFKGTDDGAYPNALVSDGAGTFYGTATRSGGYACGNYGCGTIFSFRLATRKLTVLYTFTHSGLWAPNSQLVRDHAGSLYGTAVGSGFGYSSENGGVFNLTQRGSGFVESTLHTFAGSPKDGQFPNPGLLLGPAGKALYGTTYWGGHNIGTAFEVTI